MKLLRTTLMTSAAALAIVTLAPVGVAFADTSGTPKIHVKYDELDLTSDTGAAALYGRLRAASKSVCASLDGRELRQHAAFKTCYNEALSSAVLQVNRANVTALHERATHVARPS